MSRITDISMIQDAAQAKLDEYLRTVAHIGHVEISVSDFKGSLWFFTEIMGLILTELEDDCAYLRAWQDFDHHTLILRESSRSEVNRIGWRVSTKESMELFAKQLQDLKIEFSWLEAGQKKALGDSIHFQSPSGIPIELYWEKEVFVTSASHLMSKLPSHPSKYTGNGIAPRRFDHVNIMVNDVKKEQNWWTDLLGIHHRYYINNKQEERLGSWLSRTNIAHEIALMRNSNQNGTLFHHLAYYLDSPDELIRATNILAENDLKIEWGPGKHGTSGAQFIYVFEPSGHRVEIWTGGFLIFSPDWQAIEWSSDVGQLGLEMWGSKPPETYFTYGTAIGK
ncbi:VOC family protein [Virgibacillus pantothenticus]|uniref:VOC family protein n=1 Tax=Virgibacillus pantothenticus TaxID=1473 RepID=UPI001C232E91|nr:VOC family protein [Virgibacillus pantothenticus]MBU8566429.1 VOC family protein [Virgibacillus pantothenticus]MBU8600156.1 VOC family protein [Virgibacillus pantothenticus]MBU8633912.1 VOC family protein [Virgibacillus pantothenticus]MBU8641905.1 VOC family protein [Virgibacillus pantothenticus]MBU8645689.1 VOC family protein [Virgibacillus pantothenticus]